MGVFYEKVHGYSQPKSKKTEKVEVVAHHADGTTVVRLKNGALRFIDGDTFAQAIDQDGDES